MNVEIYSRTTCPYCTKAKAYLDKHGIQYTEHNVDDNSTKQAMYDSLGLQGPQRTVPQIIVDGVRVGGYSDLIVSDVAARWKASQG